MYKFIYFYISKLEKTNYINENQLVIFIIASQLLVHELNLVNLLPLKWQIMHADF